MKAAFSSTLMTFWQHRSNSGYPLTGSMAVDRGIYGMQPVERAVASFMRLSDQGAVVTSTILENSRPAEMGSLKRKNIVTAIDGENHPRYRLECIVQRHFEREGLSRKLGKRCR